VTYTSTPEVVPFAQQHEKQPSPVVGHFSGAKLHPRCSCGWAGRPQPTPLTATRAWQTHCTEVLRLTAAQLRALRVAAVGPCTLAERTAGSLVGRDLLVRIGAGSAYDITATGRGVLAEVERRRGGAPEGE
jgi:hypothetical protein